MSNAIKMEALMVKFFRVLLLLLIFVQTGIIVADEFKTGNNAITLIGRGDVLKEAGRVNLLTYPDADIVLLQEYEKSWYNPDGTGYTNDESYTKILTEKGKRSCQVLSLDFVKPYTTVSILLLEIIKPNGKTVKVDIAANSKETIDSSQMGANIYNPDDKVLSVTIPDLQIGDILHTAVRTDITKPYIPDTWNNFYVLQATCPILRYDVEISAPAQRPLMKTVLKDQVKGTVTATITNAGDRIIYQWTAKSVPRIFEEPGMPPFYTVVQRLLVGTVPRWEDISKWYWKLCQPRLEKTTPEMKATVDSLIKDAKTPLEKINNIFQFVSKKIRYMGITTEDVAPGYEPHDVSMTFNNRYGVCRDKAALLVSMLQMAGFNAYPVLFFSGPKKDIEVPNNYFNHAISAVELNKGEYLLMDATDETTADLLPSYLCDMSYLVAKPEGETLKTSALMPADANLLDIKTTGKLNADGSLDGKTVMNFCGINDNTYRSAFSNWKPEQIKDFFAARFKGAIAGAEITDLKITPEKMSDTGTQLKAEISFKAPNFMIRGDGDTLVSPLWFGTSFGVVNFALSSTGLEKRQFPMKLFSTCGVKESYSLRLPDGLTPELIPSFQPVSNTFLNWERNIKLDGSTLNGNSNLKLKSMELSPAEYLDLKKLLKELEYQARKMPIFHSMPGAAEFQASIATADSILLKQNVDIELKQTGEWRTTELVKKKILTYAGVKHNSELKIHYNPVWDNVTLKNVTVTAPDGSSKNITEKELNVMDASWTGSAPRYPAEKILVASLPGVQVGSEISYILIKDHRNRPFFSIIGQFRNFDPVGSKKLTLSYDEKLNVNISPPPAGVKYSALRNDGKVQHTWEVSSVPAIKAEPSLPPVWSFSPAIFITTGEWKSYARQVGAAIESAAANQNAATELALKLTGNLNSTREKIVAIRNYVAENIRPAGPDFDDLPLDKVTPADKTLSDKYGNSVDRAILLCAMLRAAGFKAEPVLAASHGQVINLPDRTIQYPQSIFDSVLVRVSNGDNNSRWGELVGSVLKIFDNSKADGFAIYLNDTNQYAELGTVAHDGKYGLFLSTGETGLIETSVELKSYSRFVQKIKLKGNGDAVIESAHQYFGGDCAAWNQTFTEFTPEQRRRFYQKAVTDIAQSATPAGELVTNFREYPGTEGFTVNVKRFAVYDNNFLYCQLQNRGYLSFLKNASTVRVNPFMLGGPLKISAEYNIALPPKLEHIRLLPPAWNWTSSNNAININIKTNKVSPDNVIITSEIDIKPCVVSPEEYQKFAEIQARLNNPDMSIILLSCPPPEPALPAVVLEPAKSK